MNTPLTGLGIWIWQWSRCEGGNVDTIIAKAQRANHQA